MTANHVAGRFSLRSLLEAGAGVFVASMLLNAGGFVFHAIASRGLGVSAYGSLYALISLYSLAVIPVGLFAPVVTKYAAEFGALHDEEHVRGLIDLIARAFAILGAIYIVAGFAVAVPLASFLHVRVWEIPILGIMCATGVLSTTFRAIGQGVHNYAGYAWSMAGEGLVKVAVVGVFALAGLTVFRSTAAFLVGMIVGAACIAIPLLGHYARVAPRSVTLDWKRIAATTAGAAALAFTLGCMGFGDVILVKHFFSPTDAGLYSAASLCSKMLLYFVGFVPAILIPQATHRHARGERTRETLWFALVVVFVIALLGVAGYRVAGFLALRALVGGAFDGAVPLLLYYGGAMALLALTNTLGAYGIATHRLGFVAPLVVTTCATLLAIAVYHPTLMFVTFELLTGNAVMLAGTAIPIALQARRS